MELIDHRLKAAGFVLIAEKRGCGSIDPHAQKGGHSMICDVEKEGSGKQYPPTGGDGAR